jgi:prevent-host-death family protein
MTIKFSEDIQSVTDLKKNTRKIIDQVHKTGRPVVLTVNGRADAVLMDPKTYEAHLAAFLLARKLAEGEKDVAAGRTRPARAVLKELKRAYSIPS